MREGDREGMRGKEERDGGERKGEREGRRGKEKGDGGERKGERERRERDGVEREREGGERERGREGGREEEEILPLVIQHTLNSPFLSPHQSDTDTSQEHHQTF